LVATEVRLVHGHDATELVKIRYNFACVIFPICEHSFRSFTGTADPSKLAASYEARGLTFRLKSWSRGRDEA